MNFESMTSLHNLVTKIMYQMETDNMDDAWTLDAFKCAWSNGVLLYYADYPAYVCTFHT